MEQAYNGNHFHIGKHISSKAYRVKHTREANRGKPHIRKNILQQTRPDLGFESFGAQNWWRFQFFRILRQKASKEAQLKFALFSDASVMR